jgi:hypothetical protein
MVPPGRHRSDRIDGRCRGVGPPRRGAPDQEARLGLIQPPPFGLLRAMMVATQRTETALAGLGVELVKRCGLML